MEFNGGMFNKKIPGGYILLSRKIIESEIWSKPPLYLKVWIWLLNAAQHKEYKKLKRGQLHCQISDIQDGVSWYIGYRKVTPTKDQIYQIIDWMRKGCERGNEADTRATMIATTKATRGLLINIDNYSYYQDSKNYESNNESNNEKATKQTREQRQPNTINKNDKNDKNDKNNIYSQSELEILDYYNSKNIFKHKETNALQKCIQTSLKQYSVEQIKQAIDNYSTVFNDKDYFYKHIWRLDKFLKQSNGVPEFLSDGQAWINYKNRSSKVKSSTKPVNTGNFEQRQYDDDYFNGLYENVVR